MKLVQGFIFLSFFLSFANSQTAKESVLEELRQRSLEADEALKNARGETNNEEGKKKRELSPEDRHCETNSDCGGDTNGECIVSLCDVDPGVKTEEECSAISSCGLQTRYGFYVAEDENLNSEESCKAVMHCVNVTRMKQLPGLTSQDVCENTKDKSGDCFVGNDMKWQGEFSDKQKCLDMYGGVCWETEEKSSSLTKLKTPESCKDVGGFWEVSSYWKEDEYVWKGRYQWRQGAWVPIHKCKCKQDWKGKNCELPDGRLYEKKFLQEHGDKAFQSDGLSYRFLKYGKKGGEKVDSALRYPVEVVYTERLAYDNSVVFSTPSEKTTILRLSNATRAFKELFQKLQEGDHVEAVLLPDHHYGIKGRGKICGNCATLLDMKFVKLRKDLRLPSFKEDVVHLGVEKNLDGDSPKEVFDSFRDEVAGSTGLVTMFYSPSCVHSRNLMPIFAAASVKHSKTVPFTAVNCIEETSVCVKNSVTSYPLVKFLKGGKTMKFGYKRHISGFDQFVKSLVDGGQIKAVKKRILKKKKSEL
eukprot:g1102.t1